MRQKNNQSQSTISLLKFTPNPDYAIVIIVELLLLLLTAPFHFFTAALLKSPARLTGLVRVRQTFALPTDLISRSI